MGLRFAILLLLIFGSACDRSKRESDDIDNSPRPTVTMQRFSAFENTKLLTAQGQICEFRSEHDFDHCPLCLMRCEGKPGPWAYALPGPHRPHIMLSIDDSSLYLGDRLLLEVMSGHIRRDGRQVPGLVEALQDSVLGLGEPASAALVIGGGNALDGASLVALLSNATRAQIQTILVPRPRAETLLVWLTCSQEDIWWYCEEGDPEQAQSVELYPASGLMTLRYTDQEELDLYITIDRDGIHLRPGEFTPDECDDQRCPRVENIGDTVHIAALAEWLEDHDIRSAAVIPSRTADAKSMYKVYALTRDGLTGTGLVERVYFTHAR